jgi:quercetin dioxygenase-like cupin family protein
MVAMIRSAIRAFSLVLAIPLVAATQTMVHKSPATTTFGANPVLPSCVTLALQDGDPGTGGAIFLLKTAGHCEIPWHWHTANERLIILSGTARLEMKDSPAVVAHHGDLVVMPAKHPHHFTSEGSAEFYLLTDAPFDIHYVNASGEEIPPAQALGKPNGK